MGPEQTTAPVEEVTLGRWGPDETEPEKKRRWRYQHEEYKFETFAGTDVDQAPEPVAHPPHEPQKWADEPARVQKASIADLAAVLADVPDDTWEDPEILKLVEQLLENGWRR